MSRNKFAIASGIAVAALAVLAVVQHQTIQALSHENEALKQQVAQIAPLQEQLAHATQDTDNAGGGASARESQVHELARLRAEAQQLRQMTNELVRARQEIQTLHDRAASEAEARAAETEARRSQSAALQAENAKAQHMNACINNLRLFDAAKQQWALEQRKTANDTPTMNDLQPYLGHGPNAEMPSCPDGGVYTIGTVGEKPVCSIPGHVLP
jgi:septal ring factor EnvC (AmiA/AmiB activator)